MRTDAVAVICSFLGSRRVPRKAIKKIVGRPAIWHLINRLQDSDIPIILAVPWGQADDFKEALGSLASRIHISQGVISPLHRMAQVVDNIKPRPKWCCRITHDDILIDSKTVTELLDKCDKGDPRIGYGITPTIVEGAGVEIIRTSNLLHAANARKGFTEFVSYFVKGMEPFPGILRHEPRKEIQRNYRLTLDYEEDFTLLEIILRKLGIDAPLERICSYLDDNPQLLEINRLPKYSFYTCARNAEKYAYNAVASVYQSLGESLGDENLKSFEYIFVDDFSEDGTIDAISQFCRFPNFKLTLNQENRGLASSSNIALDNARGAYIMRIDADDKLDIGGDFGGNLKRMEKKINSGAVVVYPKYAEIDEDDTVGKEIDPRINHHAGCALFDKRFLNEIRFREGLKNWDGLELYQRVKNHKVEYFDDCPIWFYRIRDGSMSRTNLEEREKRRGEIENIDRRM